MPLAEVVFEVAAPGVLGRFTREHAGARAMLRYTATAPEARAVVTLAGPTELTASLVRELRAEAPGPAGEFEILSITPYSVVLRLAAPAAQAPWAGPAARFAEVFGADAMLEPALVEQGRLRLRGVPAAQLDTRQALARLQELQRRGGWPGFKVVAVGEFDPKALGHRAGDLLEPEQEDLLRLALVMGYYDTPRRCNLEDIAGRVGLSVSPVHKKLKEVEHRLIHAHLEPEAPPAQRRRRTSRTRAPPAPAGSLREVVVRIPGQAFPPAAFTARHPGARVVYQALPDDPDVAAHLQVVLAPPPQVDAYLAALAADPLVLAREVLSRDAEHASLKTRRRVPEGDPAQAGAQGADPLAALVAALGRDAWAKPAVCEAGAVIGRVVALRRLDEEELALSLQEWAQARGWGGAELVAVRDVSLESALLTRARPERLTDRQEEVLRIAHALGYYRTPRGCTLEDVAGTLGISANAVHKNLTSAEQRIIQGYVGGAGPGSA